MVQSVVIKKREKLEKLLNNNGLNILVHLMFGNLTSLTLNNYLITAVKFVK